MKCSYDYEGKQKYNNYDYVDFYSDTCDVFLMVDLGAKNVTVTGLPLVEGVHKLDRLPMLIDQAEKYEVAKCST